MSTIKRYTALGSSFAAGPTIEPVADAAAGRSARNYPHLLAAALDAELTDATVSGATTATILRDPQTTMDRTVVPPQINSLRPDCQLVTITAGGNDLGYAGSMLLAAVRRLRPVGIDPGMFPPSVVEGSGTLQDATERAVANLAEIVEQVRARAAAARIVLVDYLTVIGPETAPAGDVPFDEEEIERFRSIQTALESATRAAAERSGAELVAVSAVSRRHGLGSQEPWVNDFQSELTRIAGSFHPNADGMSAVAAAVVDCLGL